MPLSTNTIATWCWALLVELEKRGYEVSEAGMWSRWGAQRCVAAGHADGKWCLPTGQHPHGGLFSCGPSNSLKVRESLSCRSLTFVKEMVCYSGIAIREIMVLLQEQVTLRTSAAYTSSWQAIPASHQSDVHCEAALWPALRGQLLSETWQGKEKMAWSCPTWMHLTPITCISSAKGSTVNRYHLPITWNILRKVIQPTVVVVTNFRTWSGRGLKELRF